MEVKELKTTNEIQSTVARQRTVIIRMGFARLLASGVVSVSIIVIWAFSFEHIVGSELEWGVVATAIVCVIPIAIGIVIEMIFLVLGPNIYADMLTPEVLLRGFVVDLNIYVYGEVWPRWFPSGMWIPDPIDNFMILGLVGLASSLVFLRIASWVKQRCYDPRQ